MLEKPSSSTGSRIDRSEWIESGIRAGAIAGMIAIFAGVFYKIGMHESKVPTFPKAAMKPITPGPSLTLQRYRRWMARRTSGGFPGTGLPQARY